MRILFFSDRLSALGGGERYLWGVLAGLRGRAQTLLAVGRDDGSLPVGERPGLGPWQRIKGLDLSGLHDRGLAGTLARLEGLRREFAPGVIHAQNLMHPELLAWAAGAGASLLTVQDHRLFCPGMGKLTPDGRICGRAMGGHCLACFDDRAYGERLLDLTRRRLAAAAGFKALTVLSRYMANELAAACKAQGLACPPIRVAPPFVWGLNYSSPESAGEYHLLAGRLVERKGVLAALEAAKVLNEPLPLLVAGGGPLSKEVSQRAGSSRGQVRYLGWVGRKRMAGLLAGARSVWLPSLWAEPFGLVGLEALHLGAPVLASKVGGIGEWLEHGRTGFLLPPGDAAALARAADRLATEPGLAREMGETGARAARRAFGPSTGLQVLLDLYRSLTREARWSRQTTAGARTPR